jgi:hypothetical protein
MLNRLLDSQKDIENLVANYTTHKITFNELKTELSKFVLLYNRKWFGIDSDGHLYMYNKDKWIEVDHAEFNNLSKTDSRREANDDTNLELHISFNDELIPIKPSQHPIIENMKNLGTSSNDL